MKIKNTMVIPTSQIWYEQPCYFKWHKINFLLSKITNPDIVQSMDVLEGTSLIENMVFKQNMVQ